MCYSYPWLRLLVPERCILKPGLYGSMVLNLLALTLDAPLESLVSRKDGTVVDRWWSCLSEGQRLSLQPPSN
jgi:hypothetical protein